MPTHRQLTVETPATSRDNGSSDTASLQAAFPNSPIHSGELTDEVIRQQGQELLVDGVVNDEGHTFGEFDRDYVDAPDVETEVRTGGGGLPGSPWAPNVASPGEGVNPANIPSAGAEVTQGARGGGGAFQGDGLRSPKKSSQTVSAQKIGSLKFGKSESNE